MAKQKNPKASNYGGGYAGSGSSLSTQDRNAPIEGNQSGMPNQQLFARTVDRQPKDVAWLQSAIIAADSVYYPNQSQLFDLYADILIKDNFLRGIINKRISQVVNKRLLCLKGEEEDPRMKDFTRSKACKDIMRQVIWAKMWGLNGLEFIPGKKVAFNLIPKKHIKLKTQLITYEQTAIDEGVDYTKLKNIWILGDTKDAGGNGSTHDYGLLVVCAFLSLLKKGNISDWAQYIEIFGSPAIIITYRGYDQQAKVAAEKLLQSIGNSMRMTIPEEMAAKFEDGKMSNGDGSLQETFRGACNEEMSIMILGNTETTGHSKTGTGAKSNVHAQQQLEIIKDDMDDIVDAFNSDHFMDILRSYNLPVEGCRFEFDREVDISEIKEKYQIDLALMQAGLPFSKKYLYDAYGIPKPQDADDTIKLDPQTPSTEDTGEGAPAPGGAGRSQKGKKPGKPSSQPQAVGLNELNALLDEKLAAFFGQAL